MREQETVPVRIQNPDVILLLLFEPIQHLTLDTATEQLYRNINQDIDVKKIIGSFTSTLTVMMLCTVMMWTLGGSVSTLYSSEYTAFQNSLVYILYLLPLPFSLQHQHMYSFIGNSIVDIQLISQLSNLISE